MNRICFLYYYILSLCRPNQIYMVIQHKHPIWCNGMKTVVSWNDGCNMLKGVLTAFKYIFGHILFNPFIPMWAVLCYVWCICCGNPSYATILSEIQVPFLTLFVAFYKYIFLFLFCKKSSLLHYYYVLWPPRANVARAAGYLAAAHVAAVHVMMGSININKIDLMLLFHLRYSYHF